MAGSEHGEPSLEVIREVAKTFLIATPELLLSPLERIVSNPLSETLISNARNALRGVVSAASLPFQLASHSAHQRQFDRFYSAERIRSYINVPEGEQPPPERTEEALRTAQSKMREFGQSSDGSKQIRDSIVLNLHGHLESADVQEAAFQLLVQSTISIWSVFENFVRSFIIQFTNNDPKRAMPIMAVGGLKSFFGKQTIDIDVIHDHGFDLSTSMGDILFGQRRLDNLQIVRIILESFFEDETIRSALGDNMWTLNQRRHLMVHRCAIVDLEYLNKTCEVQALGSRIALNSDDIELYIQTVQSAILAITHACDSE